MCLASRLDAEHSTGDRSRALAYPAAVIAGLDDPLSARGPSGNHADMMGPDGDSTDARSTRTAPILPVAGEVQLGAAAFLRAHPPAAPARRPCAGGVSSTVCYDRGLHGASACCVRGSHIGGDSERCGVPIAKRGTGSRTQSSIRLSLGKGAGPDWELRKPSQQKYSRRRKGSPSSHFLHAVW